MLFNLPVKFIILLFCFLNCCQCWGHTGHMLVSTIAKLTLEKEDNDAFILGEKLSSILNIFSHNSVTNFVESACWPDDVKGHGLSSMDNWHYLDLPVRIGQIQSKNNITFTVNDALGTLNQAFKVLTHWQKSEVEYLSTQFEKSFMMRYLIHVVGDVHQPLHAASLFDNDKFINGDRGGNLFKIQFSKEIDNLHKLYDDILGRVNNQIRRPLEIEDHDYIQNIALEIMEDYQKEDLAEVENLVFEDWLLESQSICQNFVYRGVVLGARPSDEFLDTSYEMLRKRIALGGYRLAELLKRVNTAYEKKVPQNSEKQNKINQNKSDPQVVNGSNFLNLFEEVE